MTSPYLPLLNQRVIVRAHMAGVFVGIVAGVHPDGVTLEPGARQLHFWSAGGPVLQVAESGIAAKGSRVTAPSSFPVILAARAGVAQVCPMTDAAWESVMGCPVWAGGL